MIELMDVPITGREARMLREKDYERAEGEILALIKSAEDHIRPDELVKRLHLWQEIPEDIGSTVMWELIGEGEVNLSDEWYLSLSSEDGTLS